MEIVIINGTPSSGKDEFVKMVENVLGKERCFNYSTVDFVKFVAICAGWRQNKTPKHRKFLSDLKKLLKEWGDVPYRKAATEILLRETEAANNGHKYDSVLFIHCREPEEIERFVQDFGAKTLLLRRDSADSREQSNDSDSGVMEYNYDIVIENNDSLKKLQQKAEAYVKEVLMFDRKG